MIVNNIQPCPKRRLLMPLVERELTAPRTANARRGQFPRTRIGLCTRLDSTQDMQYAPRVCTLVLLIIMLVAFATWLI